MKELFESSYLSIMSNENDRLRKEIERLNDIIKETLMLIEDIRFKEYYALDEILLPIRKKLIGEDNK